MKIISRSDAIESGINKYFTGQQCKNGHIDFRYTLSGVCQSCIAENNGRQRQIDVEMVAAAKMLADAQIAYRKSACSAIVRRKTASKLVRSEKLKIIQSSAELRKIEKSARKLAKNLMVIARFRLHDVDRETFAAAAWAAALMRFSTLTLHDVDQNILPTAKTIGTGLYAFYCHHDDVDALRKLAVDIEKTHGGCY